MRSLSKSTTIMFLFDFLILSLSTAYISEIFKFSTAIRIIAIGLIVLTGLVTLFLKGYYKIREFNVTGWNVYRLFEGVIFTHIPCAVALFLLMNKVLMFQFIGINIALTFALLLIYRLGFHFYLFHIKKQKNILILGTDKRAKIISDEIQKKAALKMKVVGFVRIDSNDRDVVLSDDYVVFEPENGIRNFIKDNSIDVIILSKYTQLVLDVPYGVKIYDMPDFYEQVTGKYYIDDDTITNLICDVLNKRSRIYDFCKRVYDIIAALIILLVTLPITAYIAIRVKLTDGASPFFTQTRVGKDGKTFECYKLRTMYVNDYVPQNSEDIKYAESVKGDDRIIPWCKFVRKARFDEIPQMVNILKGDMSIVGPRAEWEDEVKIFKEQIPYYTCRMWIKTGWTGWSHISMGPCFSIEDEKERLAYDLYYIKHRNILWEIGILIKAVFLAVGGRHK